jgi:hypothetical protein
MLNSNSLFPAYLGYGLLELDSYRVDPETGIHSCRYHLHGMTIMEAEISEQHAGIREIYNGEVRGCSTDITLEKAIYNYYKDQKWIGNPIYFAWLKEIIGTGNIYVDLFDSSDFPFLFYPTVYYTTIHIPLKPDKEIIARRIVTDYDYNLFHPWVQQGVMETEYDDRKDVQKISVLSMTIPVALAYYVLNKLIHTGVISEEIRYRAIMGAAEFCNSRRTKKFTGNEVEDWGAYSLEYHPMRPSLMEA